MDAIERLATLFEKFPGIGPRQAGRFVHYLLRSSPAIRQELARSITALGNQVKQCSECRRYHDGDSALCNRCSSTTRDRAILMIVATDADADAIERSHTYNGTYFILGGTIALGNEKNPRIREADLVKCIEKRSNELREIILALPANVEGDTTSSRVHELLRPLIKDGQVFVSSLGRGLSTGAELEYADPDTIKNALKNRA
ncbi:recombination protein RecR [Candidatus Kaiserbacteria bacterium]|nr:recombination protein RecR [Candidatus Kaiserbacteria bacterium]